MSQKKAGNLLVILSNLLNPWQQLTHQDQHQTRFGSGHHGISLHMRLMQPFENLGSHDPQGGMSGLPEHVLALLDRRCHRFLGSGVGLQKQQGVLLLQLRTQFQSHGILRLEASREPTLQACLHVDQGVLITGEQFELGNLLAVWGQAVQISQVCTSRLGKQVRINRIGRGLPRQIDDDQRCED